MAAAWVSHNAIIALLFIIAVLYTVKSSSEQIHLLQPSQMSQKSLTNELKELLSFLLCSHRIMTTLHLLLTSSEPKHQCQLQQYMSSFLLLT